MRSATPNQALQTPLPSTLLSPASIFQFSLEPPHSLGVPLPHPLKRLFLLFLMFSTGCSGKIVFFAPFTATPPSPTLLKETFKALNAMRVNSHSYWLANLVNFCTTNSSSVLARERWQTFENSWKKHNI